VEEPPRVRRHGLEVPALRLRVEGAEGQRRLAGPGDPGEHDPGVAGDVHVDVAEVVLAGTTDADVVIVADVRAVCRGHTRGNTGSAPPRLSGTDV
jgi:hypothetical protein